jgi:hypothetical protein
MSLLIANIFYKSKNFSVVVMGVPNLWALIIFISCCSKFIELAKKCITQKNDFYNEDERKGATPWARSYKTFSRKILQFGGSTLGRIHHTFFRNLLAEPIS